jgi:hypothetical protein
MMVVIVNLLKRMQVMLRRSLILCAAVALIFGASAFVGLGVQAQTPSAKKNSGTQANSPQARLENPQQLGKKEILADSETLFPVGDNLVLRGYSNRRWIAQPTKVTHAVVMIHGVLRNPDNYYLPARQVLDRKSLFTTVALISVGFDDRASAPKNMQHLALFDSHWKHGGFGGLNPDDPNNSLSAFHAMDRILLDLTKTYPALRKITLIGHSAGAQFVDRYSVLSPIVAKVPGVAFQFVSLAPSSVLYPSELRPQADGKENLSFAVPSGVPGYDEYPYGLSPSPLLDRLVKNPVANRDKLADKLLHRNIVFAVGIEDTAPKYLDQSRSANAQGPNRYTRLKYFIEFLKTKYDSTSNRLLLIAGVGHYSQKLINSREMSKFFTDR